MIVQIGSEFMDPGGMARLDAARVDLEITVENDSPNDLEGFFYTINYTLEQVPEDALYFHAFWRRSNPLPDREVHTLLDGAQGQGHYVGTYIAWGVHNNGWWGEGEIKFFMDGDSEYPTICGTGTEDYFGGAWCFQDGTYSTPFEEDPFTVPVETRLALLATCCEAMQRRSLVRDGLK